MSLDPKSRILLTPVAFIALFGFVSLSKAEQNYSENYKRTLNESENSGLLSGNGYEMTLLRTPGNKPNEVTMRIMSTIAITGCVEMQNPTVEISYIGSKITIKMTEGIVTTRKNIKYAHYECPQNQNFSYVDIKLNRDELISKGTKKINFRSDKSAGFMSMAIDVNKERLKIGYGEAELRKLGFVSQKFLEKETFWFYPEGTLLLSVPRADPKQDISKELTKFADGEGLVPLKDMLSEFEMSKNAPANQGYFVDKSGLHSAKVNLARPALFGTVTVHEVVFGPGGKTHRPIELEVFASLPGSTQ